MRLCLLVLVLCCVGGDSRQAVGVPSAELRAGEAGQRSGWSELRTLDLAVLAEKAEAVVHARVLGIGCLWNERRTLIWTETRLQVLATWKGSSRGSLQLREPGGVVPPVGLQVGLAARYREGEEVVVFLVHDALGQWRTCGCIQGRFSVLRAGGAAHVSFAATPPHVVAGFFKRAESAPLRGVPLTEFEARVRQLASLEPPR